MENKNKMLAIGYKPTFCNKRIFVGLLWRTTISSVPTSKQRYPTGQNEVGTTSVNNVMPTDDMPLCQRCANVCLLSGTTGTFLAKEES